MFKNTVSIFLALCIILCLSSCNKTQTIQFKEGLTKGNRIWFCCDKMAKDSYVEEIYIINDGNIKVYDFLFYGSASMERLTLGDAVSMTSDEIINCHKNSFLTAYKEIGMPIIGGANGYSVKTYNYDIDDYNGHPSDFEVENIEFYTESDDSGNVSTLEQFTGNGYKFKYYSENEQWQKESYSFTADGIVSPSFIYDTIIGGFSNGTNKYLLTKCDLDTTFVFDEPTRE